MDSPLRCNTLSCRAPLAESAIATTCWYCFSSRHTSIFCQLIFASASHIFCIKCSESSGPSLQPDGNRTCPACHAYLPNPDDTLIVDLNPSEDYKSIVLLGLHPTAIMECAARALAFWFYQCSQEMYLKDNLDSSLKANCGQRL